MNSPGFGGDDGSDLTLRFTVEVGTQRLIEISYLRTYENIGSVRVFANGFGMPLVFLDGLWSKRYSGPEIFSLSMDPGVVELEFALVPETAICGRMALPPGFRESKAVTQPMHLVNANFGYSHCENMTEVTLRRPKFKLLSIVTC